MLKKTLDLLLFSSCAVSDSFLISQIFFLALVRVDFNVAFHAGNKSFSVENTIVLVISLSWDKICFPDGILAS